jgi:hypothetical protein
LCGDFSINGVKQTVSVRPSISTGRIEEDLQEIKALSATITGKYHDMFSNAGFKS